SGARKPSPGPSRAAAANFLPSRSIQRSSCQRWPAFFIESEKTEPGLRGETLSMTEATLKEAHILMVDDEVASTCLMTNFLHRIGYTQLQSINDSTRIFETIEIFAPDLILLDLAMPGLNGFDILKA